MSNPLKHLIHLKNHRANKGGEIKLTHAEVQALFRVDSATVNRWVKEGKLSPQLSLFGIRKYPENEIKSLLADGPGES